MDTQLRPTTRITKTSAVTSVLGAMLALLAIIVLVCIGAFLALVDASCGNQLAAVYPSPDADHKVVVFRRDCGATTRFTTHVSILKANDALSDWSMGQILVLRADPVSSRVLVEWVDDATLKISYAPNVEVVQQHG